MSVLLIESSVAAIKQDGPRAGRAERVSNVVHNG